MPSDSIQISMAPSSWHYEAGQGHLLSDDPDIDRTITELTANVLTVPDMEGVLSQHA